MPSRIREPDRRDSAARRGSRGRRVSRRPSRRRSVTRTSRRTVAGGARRRRSVTARASGGRVRRSRRAGRSRSARRADHHAGRARAMRREHQGEPVGNRGIRDVQDEIAVVPVMTRRVQTRPEGTVVEEVIQRAFLQGIIGVRAGRGGSVSGALVSAGGREKERGRQEEESPFHGSLQELEYTPRLPDEDAATPRRSRAGPGLAARALRRCFVP